MIFQYLLSTFQNLLIFMCNDLCLWFGIWMLQMGNKGAFIRFEAPDLKPNIVTFSAVVSGSCQFSCSNFSKSLSTISTLVMICLVALKSFLVYRCKI